MFRRPAPSLATDPPTVCLCANTAWYVWNFRAGLIGALRADGWNVVVHAPTDAYVPALRALGATHVPMRLENASLRPDRELLALLRIRRTLAGIRPDVVLTWTPKVNIYGALAARTLGVPVVANVSGQGRAALSGAWLARVSLAAYRIALGGTFRVFFQNRDDHDAFVRARIVAPRKAARLPGSGVDLARFRPAPPPTGPVTTFLLVARLMWDKGVGEFVEAARAIRAERTDARFVLAGFSDVDSPSAVPRPVLEGWVAEGVVEYAGAFDDMVPVYAGADCVVLPSYREGLPRSLLEAAASARPAIATDVPGCREAVVPGRTGWLVPARDPVALAGAMRAFLATPAGTRAGMGAAARARVEAEFDERIVIDAYRSVVGEALGHAGRGRVVMPAKGATARR